MGYIKLHEDIKVPVAKNVVYALKLVWKADKRLILSYLASNIVDNIFQHYIFLLSLILQHYLQFYFQQYTLFYV